MEWYDWTKEFQDEKITEDIPAKMRQIEAKWKTIKLFFTCLMVFNLVMMIPFASSRVHIEGVFVFGSVVSVVALAGVRIRCDIRLAMYRIMLEWQRNISAELRKSEAEDL